ncbi:hypothetical protein [Agrobacterium sp. 22-222-1]
MSAQLFFNATIGSLIAWSDGTPRPPERHRRKLSAWRSNNSNGRLIRKEDEHTVGRNVMPACFTLHEADYGAGGVIAIRVHRTFSSNSSLAFTIVERPSIGSCRVFDCAGDSAELVYLAADRCSAEEWLSRHGYPNAVLEEVTADEIAADVVEGRAVA